VDGELRFDPLIENRIKLGLWELTMEEAQKVIKDDKRRHEEYEYRQYIRLKKKFEGRENEFKDVE
jgi:hypothetical protein